MAIEFPCTGCSELFVVAEVTAGRKGKCPKCAVVNVVPQAKPVVVPGTAVINKLVSPASSDAAEPSAAPTEPSAPPVVDDAKPQTPRLIPPPPTPLQRRPRVSWLLIGSVGILLICLAIGGYFIFTHIFPSGPDTGSIGKQMGIGR